MYLRNTPGQCLGFEIISALDGLPATTATVTVYRSVDGGAQAPATGAVAHKGRGQYVLTMSAADCDGAAISLSATAPGCVPVEKTILPFDPSAPPPGLAGPVAVTDGTASVAGATTLHFDPVAGFEVSGASPDAVVSMVPATASNAGVVTTGTQVFGGVKQFKPLPTVAVEIDGDGLTVVDTASTTWESANLSWDVLSFAYNPAHGSFLNALYPLESGGNQYLVAQFVRGGGGAAGGFAVQYDFGAVELGATASVGGLNFAGGLFVGGALAVAAVDVAGLAAVAISGAYSDLTGRPALSTVAISGAYSDLTGRPALSAVATTGAYSDLLGIPVFGSAAYHLATDFDVAGAAAAILAGLAAVAISGAYPDLTGFPASVDGGTW